MKKLYIFLLAAAAISASCAKEQIVAPASDTEYQVFYATREAIEGGKNVLDDGIFTWAVGDQITVSDGVVYSKFEVETIENDGKAKFKLCEGENPLSEDGPFKAWYPCGIAPVNGVQSLPQQQKNSDGPTPEGKKINYAPALYTQNPMYAESGTHSLEFKNLCGLVKFNLTYPAADIAVSQIIMESYEKALFGPYTIVEGAAVTSSDPSDYGRIAVRNGNARWMSAVDTYYLAVPAGEYKDMEFSLQTNTKLFRYLRLKQGGNFKVERNKMYEIDICADDLVGQDLSRSGHRTANCYTVTQENNIPYSFLAARATESEVIPGIDHVGVLWKAQSSSEMSATQVIIDSSVSIDDKGYIHFNVANNRGNAVIAAYDASGNILWSWHIWVIYNSGPIENIELTNGTVIMNMNLGALDRAPYKSGGYYTSVLCSGLLYQWGRKDPFVGRANNGNNVAKVTGAQQENVPGPVDLATAIAHPTQYYTADSGHWCTDVADSWKPGQKTNQDPCPYGYRVPQLSELSDVWTKDNIEHYIDQVNGAGTKIVEGYYLNGVGESRVFFPTTGQLSNKNGKLSGGTIASTTSAEKAKLQTFHRSWLSDAGHNFLTAISTVEQGKTFDDIVYGTATAGNVNAYGMAVRCVRE